MSCIRIWGFLQRDKSRLCQIKVIHCNYENILFNTPGVSDRSYIIYPVRDFVWQRGETETPCTLWRAYVHSTKYMTCSLGGFVGLNVVHSAQACPGVPWIATRLI